MKSVSHEAHPDAHHDVYSKTVFGFWIYLLTDFMMFAAFFAAYAVLKDNTYGGPGAKELFMLPYTCLQSMFFLCASYFGGLGGAFAHRRKKGGTLVAFLLMFLFGLIVLMMGIYEGSNLVNAGYSWQRSAFLTAYFNLVGLLGVHIAFGLLWTIVFLIPLYRKGFSDVLVRRFTCLRMFWHFLNIIWLFIVAFVYLNGGY